MDFNQPFVSCSICHETQQSTELYLTSCAHVLCTDHASRNALNPRNLSNTKTTCPACNHDQVSLVKVDHRLPSEIRPFFTPFPTQVEQLFASAQFQYCGMAEKVQYQSDTIARLVEKVNKQKQLLLMAKEKVSQVNDLEHTIKKLEAENQKLRTQSAYASHHGHHQASREDIVDLTQDSFEEGRHQQQHQQQQQRVVTKSFIDQVKQSSTQKAVSSLKSRFNFSPRNTDGQISLDLTKGKLAESTNILRESPSRSSRPSLNTPTTVSSHRQSMSSNGSTGNNSFTSRSNEFVLPMGTKSAHAPPSRVQKSSRAATSQLAQRLSAHMKVGTAQRAHSSATTRPGSSFANPSGLFRRR